MEVFFYFFQKILQSKNYYYFCSITPKELLNNGNEKSFHKIFNMKKGVCSKIKDLREEKGFSQEIVAEKLNISQSSYSKKEMGKQKFSLEEIERIALIFGVSLTTIIQNT